jgi:hypothetical protein
MKYPVLICTIILTACGGSISDEQRKKFKEGMEMEKIVRATDSDILAEAMDKGHAAFDALKATSFSLNKIDSIEKAQNVRINFLVPGKGNALAIEQEMIDAYVNSIALGGGNQENLQKVWTDAEKKNYDSVMYSQPKMLVRADGVEELQGIWNIFIAKRDIVLNIGRKQ